MSAVVSVFQYHPAKGIYFVGFVFHAFRMSGCQMASAFPTSNGGPAHDRVGPGATFTRFGHSLMRCYNSIPCMCSIYGVNGITKRGVLYSSTGSTVGSILLTKGHFEMDLLVQPRVTEFQLNPKPNNARNRRKAVSFAICHQILYQSAYFPFPAPRPILEVSPMLYTSRNAASREKRAKTGISARIIKAAYM